MNFLHNQLTQSPLAKYSKILIENTVFFCFEIKQKLQKFQHGLFSTDIF